MTSGYYGYTVGEFRIGMRVEMHPATDLWMMGARFGDVVKVGRTRVHVKLDKIKAVKKVDPDLIRPVEV